MTADASWLQSIRPQPGWVTAEEYEALPEAIARAIEIVDGCVAYRTVSTTDHQTAGRRLAGLLDRHAAAAMRDGFEHVAVSNDVDLRLRDAPLLNRRPDVALYRCPGEEGGERLRAERALLVVEIVSAGSETQDTTDKLGEYAKAGIPHYWIVRLDRTGVSIIERYRLDRPAMRYKHIGTLMKDEHGDAPHISNPIPMVIDWSELQF